MRFFDRETEFEKLREIEENFDKEVLKAKSESFMKAVGPFKGYEIVYQGLSIEEM